MVSQNVVELLDSVMNDDSLAIVTEYCDKGDMSRWMANALSKRVGESERFAIVFETYIQLGKPVKVIFAKAQLSGNEDPGRIAQYGNLESEIVFACLG